MLEHIRKNIWLKPLLNKAWIATLLALLIVAIIPPQALAHATLIRSEPADNTTLTDPPQEVRLWFSEAISPSFSSAQILDINGRPIKPESVRIDPSDPSLMILTLPKLPQGLYSIRWKVLSETDGHFTHGPLVFGIGENLDMGATTVSQPETVVPLPEVLLRWVNFSSLLGLVGAVTVILIVLTPSGAIPSNAQFLDTMRTAQRRVLGWSKWCAGAALAAGVGLLIWQILTVLETLPNDASGWSAGWQLLTQTRWGMLWLFRQGILLALVVIIVRLLITSQVDKWPGKQLALPLVGLLLLCLLFTQALIGHAAALTPNTTLAVVSDVLHLLAAGMWAGGLLALLVGLLPLIRQDKVNFKTLMQISWRPFSRLALLSVGLLVATGLYSGGRQVASIDALLTTLYGQALLSKIGLVLLVGVFGILNSMLLHPQLAAPLGKLLNRPSGWTPLTIRQMPKLLMAEVGLGLLVVLLTGLLTASPQARGPEFEVSAEEIPSTLSQTVDDMVVTFSAQPNKPGQNVFAVRAVSTRRPPPAEVMRVILRFTFLGEDVGRTSVDAVEIEPGLYQLGGSHLSLAGPWDVQVVVRRRGIEDTIARFNWIVAPPGGARPTVISKKSLEPALTLIAAALILVISFALIGMRVARSKHLIFFQKQAQTSRRKLNDEYNQTLHTENKSNDHSTSWPYALWLWWRQPRPKTETSPYSEYDL